MKTSKLISVPFFLLLLVSILITFVLIFHRRTVSAENASTINSPVQIYYYQESNVYGKDFHVKDIEPLVVAGHVNVVNYAYINLDVSGNCTLYDSWAADERPGQAPYTQTGNLRQLAALRDNHISDLKIILSIGGWDLSDHYSSVIADPLKRANMISSCTTMMNLYGFDGLDLNWQYPGGGGQAGNSADPINDKANFAALITELRAHLDLVESFTGKDYHLTGSFSAHEEKLTYLPMTTMATQMDYISVMGFDMNDTDQSRTGHNAPLYTNPNDPQVTASTIRRNYNIDFAIEKFINGGTDLIGNPIDGGIPRAKLVLGVPFSGHSWSNVPNTEIAPCLPGLFANANPGTNVGTFSADYSNMSSPMWDSSTSPGTLDDPIGNASGGSWEEGVWDYDDIRNRLLPLGGYTRYWDVTSMVPYAYNPSVDGGTLVSYDDAESVGVKAKYATSQCLGGLMVWEMSSNSDNTDLYASITTELASYNPASCTVSAKPTTSPSVGTVPAACVPTATAITISSNSVTPGANAILWIIVSIVASSMTLIAIRGQLKKDVRYISRNVSQS